MARDTKKLAIRAGLQCAGDESGQMSNTFYFQFLGTVDPTVSDWDNLCNAVRDFYKVASTGHQTIASFFGPQISINANAHECAVYQLDLADPRHYFGSPVHVTRWNTPIIGGGQALPNEVALTLSYRTLYGTDPEHSGTTRPRASDRGRLYIGGLGAGAVTNLTLPDGTAYCVPVANLVASLKGSATALWNTTSIDNAAWSVWSRKEQAFKPVVDIAVDSNLDTQRRRGLSTPLQTWLPLPQS